MPTTNTATRARWLVVLCVLAIAAVTLGTVSPARSDPGAASAVDLSTVGDLVDDLVPRLLQEGQIPGAAVSVVSHGKVVFSAGYGLADIDSRSPVTPKTGFYAASTAKLFTAAAVLQLVDAGKLDLHADVNRYLTSFQIKDTYPGKPITLQHLLTNTAGFDPDYGMVGTARNDPKDLPSLAESLAAKQPARVHPPGTVLAYDNYGVALAGLVVAEASGIPYDKYINERVYQPLRMSGSTASQPHPTAIEDSLATGYRPNGDGQTVTAGNANPWSPTGPGQVTTADDMARFMIDQLAEKSALGTDIPQRMQRQQYAQDPRMPGMGYIYEERPHNGIRLLFKGGDGSGFHNDMYLLPDAEVGLFITVNGDGNDEADAGDVIDAIVDEYFPGTAPTTPKPIDDKDVTEYEGAYQSSRTSRHSMIKARALTQSLVVVTANPDGTLTTTDRTLSTNPDADSQIWMQIDPGLFREVDGRGLIAFDGDGVLTESRGQNQVYLKIAWYENPTLHIWVAVAGVAGLLIGLLAIPVLAVVRRLRDTPAHSGGAKAARLIAWVTAALGVGGAIGVVTLLADQSAAIEVLTLGSPVLNVVMVALSLAVLSTAGVCVGTAIAWWRGWWQLTGRLSYSLLALSAVAFSTIAVTYNLIGPPFD